MNKTEFIKAISEKTGLSKKDAAAAVAAALETITETIKGLGAMIFEIDFERTERSGDKLPAAIIVMKLAHGNESHSAMLSSIAELNCVCGVRELIS